MTKGITILNKEPIYNSPYWYVILIGILLAISLIVFVCASYKSLPSWLCAVLVIISVPIVFGAVYFNQHTSVESGRYIYECLIDDNVSASYIYENYEVISKRGDIWKIADIENT